MDWVDLLTRLGAPALFIYLAGRWFTSHGWPFIMKVWEEQTSERKAERDKFLDILDRFRQDMIEMDVAHKESSDETRGMFLSAIDDHREQLVAMARNQETMVKNQQAITNTQEAITKTQVEIKEYIQNGNGKK